MSFAITPFAAALGENTLAVTTPLEMPFSKLQLPQALDQPPFPLSLINDQCVMNLKYNFPPSFSYLPPSCQ